MDKLILDEKIVTKDWNGNISMMILDSLGGNCRIEFNAKRGSELSQEFYLQLKYDYIHYINSLNLGFPGCIVASSDRYVCFDAKSKDGKNVFNQLKKKLLNYFEIV